MNNEPVAWMQTLLDGHTGEVKHTLEFIRVGINDIPLYTHPAKELTDEEIEEIVKDCIEDDYNMISNPYLVARAVQEAILRKAQEK